MDFSESREHEWLDDSACSTFLRNILYKGDPDGFQIVKLLNQWHELSLQKKVTSELARLQKLGWPWPGLMSLINRYTEHMCDCMKHSMLCKCDICGKWFPAQASTEHC